MWKTAGDTRINILQSTHTSSGAQLDDLSMETRQPGHEADHSPLSSAKVKNSMNRDNFIVTHTTSCLHIAVAHTWSAAAPVCRKLIYIVAITRQASESYFNGALHEQNNTPPLSMPYKYNNDFGFYAVWWLDKLRDSICFVHGMMEMHGEIHLSSHTKCPQCVILTKIKMVAAQPAFGGGKWGDRPRPRASGLSSSL
jgi:hypothetical protein